jgi:RNA polymerase sigma-70 factor (ECF subfamily)
LLPSKKKAIDLEDKELIGMLQNPLQREEGFRLLVNIYKKRLYWHIRSLVLLHDDADDVLQNTFIKVFRNIDKFRADSALYTWMFRIATNESLSFLKSAAKKMNMSLELVQQERIRDLKSDPYFDGDELELSLQEAIVTLPERQQMVFRMKYSQDMKYEEISELLGTSVGSLKASYHHARKKVEEQILKNAQR